MSKSSSNQQSEMISDYEPNPFLRQMPKAKEPNGTSKHEDSTGK